MVPVLAGHALAECRMIAPAQDDCAQILLSWVIRPTLGKGYCSSGSSGASDSKPMTSARNPSSASNERISDAG